MICALSSTRYATPGSLSNSMFPSGRRACSACFRPAAIRLSAVATKPYPASSRKLTITPVGYPLMTTPSRRRRSLNEIGSTDGGGIELKPWAFTAVPVRILRRQTAASRLAPNERDDRIDGPELTLGFECKIGTSRALSDRHGPSDARPREHVS